MGKAPTEWTPKRGGYSGAHRWVVRAGDGSTVFVKVGATEHTRGALRAEYRIYSALQPQPFMARLRGWEDDPDHPLLLLEDLTEAFWPPPWSEWKIARVFSVLDQVARTRPPEHLDSAESYRQMLSGWQRVAHDPSPFLRLRLVSANWLEQCLPALIAAARGAQLDGQALVHCDVRSDNVCFDGGRTILLDWPDACRGNPLLDVVSWLPSLALEGGPPPDTLVGAEAAELAGLVSGYWAAQAGLPPPESAPTVRSLQLAQLRVALPWAARGLHLPPPDGPAAS
jgi:hypothetical protein